MMGRRAWAAAALMAACAPGWAAAQVRTIDPNRAVDGDLAGPTPPDRPPARGREPDFPAPDASGDVAADPADVPPTPVPARPVNRPDGPQAVAEAEQTYAREDLLAAGEGVFGKGAAGLAGILERVLKEQGRPNAYIAGREASGAIVVGLRYGSGVMTHKVEGTKPVYWTGPSVGFDLGGDANKVFVLAYNLYDSEELYKRFPAAEGRLYAVGGFAATYLRSGNVVLIPIRLGVGWRAGVNVGYMNFTHKSRWLPF